MILGFYFNGRRDVACYWKNGNIIDIQKNESFGGSIFVLGNDTQHDEFCCYNTDL